MSLESLLAPSLPKSSVPYHILNVSSTPKKSKRVFHTKEKQTTIKTQHLITVSQNETIIFGIELYVYVILYDDRTERLLFVSKADTTGLFNPSLASGANIKIGDVTRQVMSYILRLPLSYYLDNVLVPNEDTETSIVPQNGIPSTQRSLNILISRWRENKDLQIPLEHEKAAYKFVSYLPSGPLIQQICLFTRPEPQYLFPYSNKNSGKHILSGEQLLKWWCKSIDSIASSDFTSPELKLLIPGAEARTVQRYFPGPNWKVGDIFSNDHTDLAIQRIPLFPDDPKCRFIEHLIVENRVKKVKMKPFWLELSVRQEFRLGIVVGVIGVKGTLKHQETTASFENMHKLRAKFFKEVKAFITDEDYSKRESLESFHKISKLRRDPFTRVWGEYERSEKRAIDETSAVPAAQPMMVIKRKKKAT